MEASRRGRTWTFSVTARSEGGQAGMVASWLLHSSYRAPASGALLKADAQG